MTVRDLFISFKDFYIELSYEINEEGNKPVNLEIAITLLLASSAYIIYVIMLPIIIILYLITLVLKKVFQLY